MASFFFPAIRRESKIIAKDAPETTPTIKLKITLLYSMVLTSTDISMPHPGARKSKGDYVSRTFYL
jgi:hypothetical protein